VLGFEIASCDVPQAGSEANAFATAAQESLSEQPGRICLPEENDAKHLVFPALTDCDANGIELRIAQEDACCVDQLDLIGGLLTATLG